MNIQRTASKTAFRVQNWLFWRYFKMFFSFQNCHVALFRVCTLDTIFTVTSTKKICIPDSLPQSWVSRDLCGIAGVQIFFLFPVVILVKKSERYQHFLIGVLKYVKSWHLPNSIKNNTNRCVQETQIF